MKIIGFLFILVILLSFRSEENNLISAKCLKIKI